MCVCVRVCALGAATTSLCDSTLSKTQKKTSTLPVGIAKALATAAVSITLENLRIPISTLQEAVCVPAKPVFPEVIPRPLLSRHPCYCFHGACGTIWQCFGKSLLSCFSIAFYHLSRFSICFASFGCFQPGSRSSNTRYFIATRRGPAFFGSKFCCVCFW